MRICYENYTNNQKNLVFNKGKIILIKILQIKGASKSLFVYLIQVSYKNIHTTQPKIAFAVFHLKKNQLNHITEY